MLNHGGVTMHVCTCFTEHSSPLWTGRCLLAAVICITIHNRSFLPPDCIESGEWEIKGVWTVLFILDNYFILKLPTLELDSAKLPVSFTWGFFLLIELNRQLELQQSRISTMSISPSRHWIVLTARVSPFAIMWGDFIVSTRLFIESCYFHVNQMPLVISDGNKLRGLRTGSHFACVWPIFLHTCFVNTIWQSQIQC